MKSFLFYQRLGISCLVILSLFCHQHVILAAEEGSAQEPPQPIDPPRTALDPLAEAVIQSIRYPEPTTPRGWLEAAIKAIDVDALADAVHFYRRFLDAIADEDGDRNSLLADIGDSIDDAHLHRLYRTIAPYEPDAPKLIQSILFLASQRKREPKRIEEAINNLRSDNQTERLRALDQLSSTGIDALPQLIKLLQTTDDEHSRARSLALGLIHNLGSDGHDILLSWLGSDDRAHWPGIIKALSAVSDEDAVFLLAPALAADSPPSVTAAANTSLAALGFSPTLREAREILALELNHALSPVPLPAGGTGLRNTVEIFLWNPTQGIPELTKVTMQNAQARRANHLARDLAALSPTDPKHIELVILARIAFLASAYSDNPDKLTDIPEDELMARIAGPQGYDPVLATAVLREASARKLIDAATATIKAIRIGVTNEKFSPPRQNTQSQDTRDALLSAMRLPCFELKFEAAWTLAICGGQPPYHQSTKVLETLIHAATSTGVDRAIVAHPNRDILEAMSTSVSRFGYQPIRVRSSRDAILAARHSIDTAVILLAAKLDGLSTAETIQILRSSSTTASVPVLVIVDPLDDQPLSTFMTHLTTSLRDLEGVAIADRMESFFQPETNTSTGTTVRPARFSTALSEASGHTSTADRQWRRVQALSRRSRAIIALEQLTLLGQAGWDVSKAASIAQEALLDDDTHLAAVSFLSVLGTPVAQQTLYYEARELDLPATQRSQARDGFATSVRRNGILLESRHLLDLSTLYNKTSDPRNKQVAQELIKILESHEIRFKNIPSDAQKDLPN